MQKLFFILLLFVYGLGIIALYQSEIKNILNNNTVIITSQNIQVPHL